MIGSSSSASSSSSTHSSQDLEALLLEPKSTVLGSCSALLGFIHRDVWMGSGSSMMGSHQSSPGWTSLYRLLPLVLDRVFGEVHRTEIDVQCDGGWMYAVTRFYDGVQDLNQTAGSGVMHMHAPHMRRGSLPPRVRDEYVGLSREALALVKLLTSVKPEGSSKVDDSLFNIMRMKHSVSFTFPLSALPGQSYKFLQHNSRGIVTHNARLYTHCLENSSVAGSDPSLSPQLMLTMIEMYLFLFAQYAAVTSFVPHHRYGSSGSQSRPARMHQAWLNYGIKGLTRGNPYNILVLHYAGFYFPHSSSSDASVGSGDDRMPPGAELYLRCLAEFWLNQCEVVNPTSSTAPIDSAILGDYRPPSDMALHGALVLVTHLLADPSLRARKGSMKPALVALQPQVFEFLRLTFNTCSLRGNSTAFALAVELWLVWLQPWLAADVLKGGSPGAGGKKKHAAGAALVDTLAHAAHVGGDTAASLAHHENEIKDWSHYIIENVSMYSILLPCFVRRAKDLSYVEERQPGEIGIGVRPSGSVALVERVLKVFSPALVSVLDECHRAGSPDGLSLLLGSEGRALPLSTYSEDACNLIEEVMAQLRPTSANNLLRAAAELLVEGVARMQRALGTDTTTPEDRISAAVRRIFSVPPDWIPQSSPAGREKAQGLRESGAASSPESRRDFLTDAGRRQIALGKRKCDRRYVSYIGDPMLRPVESYEIAWLAQKLVALSLKLNEKYCLDRRRLRDPQAVARVAAYEDERPSEAILRGRVTSDTFACPQQVLGFNVYFRFNLRYLADYRNLLFFAVLWLAKSLVGLIEF